MPSKGPLEVAAESLDERRLDGRARSRRTYTKFRRKTINKAAPQR